MTLSFWQFVIECIIAYPVSALTTLFVAYCLSQLFGGAIPVNHYLDFLVGPPVLAAFWLTAGAAASLVAWCARRIPGSIVSVSRAGEWVWVAGSVWIIIGFFTYMPLGRGWEHKAIYELFVSTYDIGNMATAPFYMGIAYSVTRHLMRMRADLSDTTVGPDPHHAP